MRAGGAVGFFGEIEVELVVEFHVACRRVAVNLQLVGIAFAGSPIATGNRLFDLESLPRLAYHCGVGAMQSGDESC